MSRKGVEMSGKIDKQEASRTRGGRLARRARSFKEDLLEKITQMRSPSSARSASPNKASPHTKHKHDSVSSGHAYSNEASLRKNDKKDVHQLQKDVQFTLKYFQDVVDKNTLEMLPGSATVVLESVLNILTLLKNSLTNEQSSLLMSTTNQVYQSLANLIRWADNILLHGDLTHNKENVAEIVKAVQDATKILVQFVEEKMHNKDNKGGVVYNGICTVKPESPKRTSLPDIPLTPREREILEQTNFNAVDDNQVSRTTSVSSDTVLRDNNNGDIYVHLDPDPPPKPPLPNNWDSSWLHTRCPSVTNVLEVIPPLPPKRRGHTSADISGSFQSSNWNGSFSPLSSSPHTQNLLDNNSTDCGSDWSKTPPCANSGPLRTSSSEWTSPLSVSPESMSPLSASASSLDSVLNRSADDLLSTGIKPCTSIRLNSSLDFQSKFMNSSCFSYGQSLTSTMKLQEFSCHSGLESSCAFSEESTSSAVFSSNTSSSFTVQSSSCINSSNNSSLNTSVTIHSSGKSAENKSESITIQNSTSSEELWSTKEANEIGIRLPPPPAIPPKKRTVRNRTPSQYDNVPDLLAPETADDQQQESSSPSSARHPFETQTFCLKHSESHSVFTSTSEDGEPPPLPPKKKHIMAYVQMIGNYSEPSKSEFFRHSMHTYNLLQAQWQQQQCELSLMHMRSLGTLHLSSDELSSLSDSPSLSIERSFMEDPLLISPPALPPKRNRASVTSGRIRPSTSPTTQTPPMYELKEKSTSMIENSNGFAEKDGSQHHVTTTHPDYVKRDGMSKLETGNIINPLDEIHVEEFLVYKKTGEEGPDIRGGSVDALIVQATKVNKNDRTLNDKSPDFMYQEAFLTTYRTFITPLELTKKLLYRYDRYNITSDVMKQRAARNAFALLVRVVDDLCVKDIDDVTLQTLMDFVFHLLCNGDLILARALRKKILEKCEVKKRSSINNVVLLSSFGVTTRQSVLLDFKSEHLAEQMTLLDADLFQKIEIPEVLIWAREQSEELSPNLTTFTEHFNKMSYWARSRILEQDDGKDREKYVVKFIKIMKHLRKLNNFNSYLAILSALDSAPIRRLEWQKHITEGLKEYCELIDSSSSFRAYRQALAETDPPCIPYIGLILQDLTFVHIGNSDLFPDGNINFSKRWQQFNILDNMRRFKKCNYLFKRHDRIIAFFNNFDDYLCEEAMWQISESIKPRGGKKKMDHP